MPILQLIVLAIVQGLTEFIPVSSSAHLILPQALFDGWQDQGRAIDVAAHVGSLGAVMLYFRQETTTLFHGGIDTLRFKPSAQRTQFLFIAVATVPLVLVGFALAATGLADQMRSPTVIAWASIIFGVLLFVADRRPVTLPQAMPDHWKAVLTIGAAQALATIPGTSRSGITMTAARWLGYGRESAARFSMVLAIPAIAAAGTYEGVKLAAEGADAPLSQVALVTVLSFAAAWVAIDLFLKLTRKMSFTPFVMYRIGLGVALLLFFS